MDLFTISVSSVNSGYSADYGSVTPYVHSLGSTTSDGTWIVRTPITGAFAPYTLVKLTALNTGSGFWTNNIDWLKFYFNDLYSPAVLSASKAGFIASGFSHTYGPPGQFYFGMTAHTVAGGTSSLYIGNIIVGEIAPKPYFTMFDGEGDTVVLNTSAHSPYTVTFAATATLAGSYKPDSLTWHFADRTDPVEITRFETTTPRFQMFGPPPRPGEANDPRNYVATHTYYRQSRQFERIPLSPSLEVRSMVTATTTTSATSGELGPLLHTRTENRRLIKARCYGSDNKILLISENDQGQVFQHLNFNLSGRRAPILDL